MVAHFCLDGFGILDGLPGHLRESVAFDKLAPFLVTECVLLAVGAVPHPVHEEIDDAESRQGNGVPAVL